MCRNSSGRCYRPQVSCPRAWGAARRSDLDSADFSRFSGFYMFLLPWQLQVLSNFETLQRWPEGTTWACWRWSQMVSTRNPKYFVAPKNSVAPIWDLWEAGVSEGSRDSPPGGVGEVWRPSYWWQDGRVGKGSDVIDVFHQFVSGRCSDWRVTSVCKNMTIFQNSWQKLVLVVDN